MTKTFNIASGNNLIFGDEITQILNNGKLISNSTILKDNSSDTGAYWGMDNSCQSGTSWWLHQRILYSSNKWYMCVMMSNSGIFNPGISVTVWATLYYTKNS